MADDCRQAHFNKNPHCPWGLVVLDRGEGVWEWEPGRGGLEGGEVWREGVPVAVTALEPG